MIESLEWTMLVSAHANAVFEITFSALTATRTLFEDTAAVVLCLALLEPMISSLSIAFGSCECVCVCEMWISVLVLGFDVTFVLHYFAVDWMNAPCFLQLAFCNQWLVNLTIVTYLLLVVLVVCWWLYDGGMVYSICLSYSM